MENETRRQRLQAAAPKLLAALEQSRRALPEGPAREAAAAAIQEARGETTPDAPEAPILEALIHGTKAQIELAGALLDAPPEYCMIGDNGAAFLMSSGPIPLESIARALKLNHRNLTPWEDLSEADRLAWASVAAGNINWALDSENLDPCHINDLIEEVPGTLERLINPRPPTVNEEPQA